MSAFEVIVMIGIPASGKTTFCRDRFFPNKVYISLDQLRSRKLESELFFWCMRNRKSCVIDNTNVNPQERARYIPLARISGARVIGYCFRPDYESCIERNAQRNGRARVPEVGMRQRHRAFSLPSKDEGFDELYDVRLVAGEFEVEVFDEARNQ